MERASRRRWGLILPVALAVTALGGLVGVGFVLSADDPSGPVATPSGKASPEAKTGSKQPIVRVPFPGYARGIRVTLHVSDLGTLTECDRGTYAIEEDKRLIVYYTGCPGLPEDLRLFWVQVFNFSDQEVPFRLRDLDLVDDLGDVYPARTAGVTDAFPSGGSIAPDEQAEGWLPVRVEGDFSPVEIRYVDDGQTLKITFDGPMTVERS